ncbi:hypothetical protein Daesc_003848 [Daldinia eschscholtzii]|uniref:Rhodopsin domain-containing protein n=1 Tax=Daldinia eschscholtzii TaxID=292717 RepID=A0AAX6MN32_9PEZI
MEQSQDIDWCSIPVGANPHGLPPNFEDPPTLQPTTIAMSAITITIAVIVTSGRLFINRKAFRLADYFIIVGLIFDLGTAGVLIAHTWYMKLTFVESLIVGPALFFPKAAIFLFYLQVFSIKKSVRVGSKVGLVMAFLAYIPASLVLCYFDAPHVGQTWEDVLRSGLPTRGIPGGITIGVASVIVDIYIFILPLPTIFSLNMDFSKRIQLIALFTTAFMGIVASVVCLAYRIKLLGPTDNGWQAGSVVIAIIVENNVAIIVGSLPVFVNFLRLYVYESAIYKSLRSKLSFGSRDGVSGFEQGGSWPDQAPWTYGSPQERQPQYHELTSSAVLSSQVTVPEGALNTTRRSDQGIPLTVDIPQEVQAHQSLERLVWTDPADNEQAKKATQALMEVVDQDTQKLNVHGPFIYLNYAAPWKSPIESYRVESIRRLRKIAKEVNPHGIFVHQVPGGFKLED